MRKLTKEINKISLAVISFCAKLLFYALVAVLLVTGAKKGYAFGHSIFYAPGMEAEPGRSVVVTLDGDESVSEVGKLLQDKGLIRDKNAFALQAFCYEYKVKKGTFELNTSESSKELIHILDAGIEGGEQKE